MTETSLDHERARVTARSMLANLELLACEGLRGAERDDAVRHAEALTSVDGPIAAEHARELRRLLAGLIGPTATVLVTWIDDALDPEDRPAQA